jgi:hypothetical protein
LTPKTLNPLTPTLSEPRLLVEALHGDDDFGFRVSGFEFRVSSFEFRRVSSGFGFRVSNLSESGLLVEALHSDNGLLNLSVGCVLEMEDPLTTTSEAHLLVRQLKMHPPSV